MINKHHTSIVSEKAILGSNVTIGPYCIINDNVKIGNNVNLMAHIYVDGNTIIGDNCRFFPYCSIGTSPQDLKYKGEKSKLKIGDNNIFREYVTVNPGTEGGGLETTIGNNCLFMINAHVAHDCKIGNNVIMVNNASIAGHVILEDYAIMGALSGAHQFCRIGKHSMIGGLSGVDSDVIPYGTVLGNRAYLSGLNIIGLKRRGFSKDIIQDLRKAYGLLFSSQEGTFSDRVKEVSEEFLDNEPIQEIVQFLKSEKSRSICKPKNAN
ncbi:MAG: acyl-ACP--UDP-N-acetylglucosamine O-acyltransferase [Alphaproteobacteria bacterium TMED194]|nr:MAG: acyl-ACP--UDP-N-acetylglucosamine O-acyltransferase [Alphaproteobacteria bacterium TMED194]|tara:strand:+ start:377 stop:1174 length:798 start_codon:yes stop_codon:yes gene_type:complete